MPNSRQIILAFVSATLLFSCSSGPDRVPDEAVVQASPVHLRVLAFNDFHGHVQGPSGTVKVAGEAVEAGGADYFAAHIAALREGHPNTIVVAAGDLIGASPLVSALFNDEPTIEALGKAGLDISSVGNHEFDAGVEELLRIQNGGCHPETGCTEGHEYKGAEFTYLAANVRFKETGETIFPAYEIREYEGIKVGIIGLTLEGTPDVVSPESITTVTFDNEIEVINANVALLQEQGIETIIVLIHEGGLPGKSIEDINGCPDITGPIVTIAEGSHEAVDVFVTGHTHQPYICEFGGKLVTSSQSFGRLITKIDLVIDPATGDVVDRTARQVVISRDIEPVAHITALVASYEQLSAALADRVVGRITQDLSRHANDAGESVLGQIIADAQLAATADAAVGEAQIAFMNPGGIRDALLFNAPNNAEEGVVTYRQLHTAQPFGNNLITMTLTGAQIYALLEQQWVGQDRARPLQVSSGFTYTWNAGKAEGERVVAGSVKLHGEVVKAESEYRVTVNNFLASGGDGFTVLTEGTDILGGPVDLQALVNYFEQNSPIEAGELGRIVRVEE